MKKIYFILFAASILINACTKSNASPSKETEPATHTEKILENVDHSWDGTKLPKYPTGDPNITLLKISIAPGAKLARHYHSVINVGYMLKGELTVRADKGVSKVIKEGEPLIELVDDIHYGENTGKETAVILVFYAGDGKTPITTPVE